MERSEWEDCYSGHGGQIQETAEWIWILRYGSGSDTDSSLLNHSKWLLCYVKWRTRLINNITSRAKIIVDTELQTCSTFASRPNRWKSEID